MITIQDIINELMRIREAVDGIEVRGNQNASYVCYAYSKCNDLINALTDVAKQVEQNQNGSNSETITEPEPEITLTEVGEEIGD